MAQKGIDVISADLSKKLGRVALKTQNWIKKEMPTKTGRAKNSVVVFKNEDGTWTVGSNLDYMVFIELDTRPHEITPLNKNALYWPGAMHPVKKVMHPGTTGKFIFLRASMIARKILQDELKN